VKAYLLYLLLEIQIFSCKELDIVLHIPQLHISVLRTRRLLSELVNLNLKLHTVGPKIIDQGLELRHFFGLFVKDWSVFDYDWIRSFDERSQVLVRVFCEFILVNHQELTSQLHLGLDKQESLPTEFDSLTLLDFVVPARQLVFLDCLGSYCFRLWSVVACKLGF